MTGKQDDILRIDSEPADGAEIVRLTGVIDAHTYEEVQEHLEQVISGGVARIVIDFHGVRYISSSGIGVFIGALARARQNGGDLLLLNVTATVRETFSVLGLLPMFFVAPNKQAALAYFDRRGGFVRK